MAITPLPIIAVILMLFSRRPGVNGRVFLLGWVLALAVGATVVYLVAQGTHPSTSRSASDTISWIKIALGVVLLLLAVRHWRNRPKPGTEPEMPKWMAGAHALTPPKAFGLAVLLAGVNPANTSLTIGAATGLAQLGLSTTDAVVSLIAFVLVASLTILAPVIYYALGGDSAKTTLDEVKDWLRVHSDAVIVVLFLVFGVDLIAAGLRSLT